MAGKHDGGVVTSAYTMKFSLGLGKYRDLLLAILLFIVLDLGILFFNFFASIQLERDASRINTAGELRMLTQQITKSLLTLQSELRDGLPIQTSMAQLGQGTEGFNQGLEVLRTSMASDGEFRFFGIDPQALRDLLQRLDREWQPLNTSIAPVLAVPVPAVDDTDMAATKAVARNIRLMGQSDDLAQAVEAAAGQKTRMMRTIQVAAIALALLNFVFIVFKFVRRLNASDRIAEAARQETEDILLTVSEGLLLVGADGRVGSQISTATHKMFMRKVRPGDDFRQLLSSMLERERAEEAHTYLTLLLDPKVKPALLSQLDPLQEVPVFPPEDPHGKPRYLSFQVSQVRDGARIKELLITVFDMTQKVQLERELVATQQAAKNDVEDLIVVLEQEPLLLQDFLLSARTRLADLNQNLRNAGREPASYKALVDDAARLVHGIKGEAAALGSAGIARQAHEMENTLAPLLRHPRLRGEDLIPVVVELSRLQDQVDRLHRFFLRVGQPAASRMAPNPLEAMVDNLRALSHRVAQSLGKEVRLSARLPEAGLPPEVERALREALPQLVRNAVVHGIERPQERELQNKPAVGELRLDIVQGDDGAVEVRLSDDGRGIALPQVRERIAQLRTDAAQLSDMQVLGHIFDPAISTATEVTEHAGRGVGLSLVRQIVDKAGAKLRVLTQPNKSTTFILRFGGAA
jgi:HPt (histidine-containing phosphotransfer) domain-containing protein